MSQNRRIQSTNLRQQGTTGTTLNERFATLHENGSGINKFGGGRSIGQTATFQFNRNFGRGNGNVAVSFAGRGGNAHRNGRGRGGRGAFRKGKGQRSDKPKRILTEDEKKRKIR